MPCIRRSLAVAVFAYLLVPACSVARSDCVAGDVFCEPVSFFIAYQPARPVAVNIVSGGAVETGFLIGTVEEPGATVEVSLDGGAFLPGTTTGTSWRYALPAGASVWKRGSNHTIQIRSRSSFLFPSETVTLSVKKGVNRDVNGDGYADFIAHDATDATAGSNSGAAYLFYGGTSAIVGQGAANAALKIPGKAPSDRAGERLAFGDYNGDGYGDMAIGVPNADNGATVNTGLAAVFFGSSNGITQTDFALADVQVYGGAANDTLGRGLDLGDVNGDGFDDIITTANNASGTRGEAYIVHGSASAASGTAATLANTVLVGENVGDELGGDQGTVATGDLDGDGYMDVFISAVMYPGGGESGRLYVYYGSAGGIAGGNTATAASATLTGDNAADLFGHVDTGDYNNDGFADLIVGAPQFTPTSNGRLYLFLGGTARLTTVSPSTASLIIDADQSGVRLGDSDVMLKDLDGDSYDDIVAPAPNYIFDGTLLRGTVYVFRGAAALPTTAPELPTAAGTITSATSGNGQSQVSAADLNGDGIRELMIGNLGAAPGTLYIFTGTAGSVPSGAAATANALITGENGSSQFSFHIE